MPSNPGNFSRMTNELVDSAAYCISHVVFGTDDNLPERSSGLSHQDFKPPDLGVYESNIQDQIERKGNLTAQHFKLGETGSCTVMRSVAQEAFVGHSGSHRARLADDVRSDLKASHFSIGSGDTVNWETTNQNNMPHPGRSARAGPIHRLEKPLTLSWDQPTDYSTEMKEAFKRFKGDHKTTLAEEVRRDLRASHFTTSTGEATEYISETKRQYVYKLTN
jgi:hypothetical protein